MYAAKSRTLVTPGVLFFLTWSFFPKKGFGQGGFNEAPHIQYIKRRVLNYTTFLRFYSHIHLSSPPLPQVSGLGRTPLTCA